MAELSAGDILNIVKKFFKDQTVMEQSVPAATFHTAQEEKIQNPVQAANKELNDAIRSGKFGSDYTGPSVDTIAGMGLDQQISMRHAQSHNTLVENLIKNTNQMDPYVALQKILEAKGALKIDMSSGKTVTNAPEFKPILDQLQQIEEQRKAISQQQYPHGALGRVFSNDPLTRKYIEGSQKGANN